MINTAALWTTGLLLALSVICVKQLTALGLVPIFIACMRALSATVLLTAFGLRGLRHSLKHHWKFFLVASLIGFTLPQLIIFSAVPHVGTGPAALTYAMPLIITFTIVSCLTKQRPTVGQIALLTLIFVGALVFLYQPDMLPSGKVDSAWIIILLLAPISIGAANVYRSFYWPKGLRITHAALLTNLFSTLSYFLVMPAIPMDTQVLLSTNASAWLWLVGLMLCNALGQLLLFFLQQNARPAFIGQIGSITAFFGGVLAWLVDNTSYTLFTFFGSVMILVGVFIFSRDQLASERREKAEKTAVLNNPPAATLTCK